MSLGLKRNPDRPLFTFAETYSGQERLHDLDLNQEFRWQEQFPELSNKWYGLEDACDVMLVKSKLALPAKISSYPPGELELNIVNSFCTSQSPSRIGRSIRTTFEFFENGYTCDEYKYTDLKVERQERKDRQDDRYSLPLGSSWWVKKLPSLWDYKKHAIAALNSTDPLQEARLHEIEQEKEIFAKQTLRSLTVIQEVFNDHEEQWHHAYFRTTTKPFLLICWKFDLAPEGMAGQTTWQKVLMPPMEDYTLTAQPMEWPKDTFRNLRGPNTTSVYGNASAQPLAKASLQPMSYHEKDIEQLTAPFNEVCETPMNGHSSSTAFHEQAYAGMSAATEPFSPRGFWKLPIDPAIASVEQPTCGGHILRSQHESLNERSLPRQPISGHSDIGQNFDFPEQYCHPDSNPANNVQFQQPFTPMYAATSSIRSTQQSRSLQSPQGRLDSNAEDTITGGYEESTETSHHLHETEGNLLHEGDHAKQAQALGREFCDQFTLQSQQWAFQGQPQLGYEMPDKDVAMASVQQASTAYQQFISSPNDSECYRALHDEAANSSHQSLHRYPTRSKLGRPPQNTSQPLSAQEVSKSTNEPHAEPSPTHSVPILHPRKRLIPEDASHVNHDWRPSNLRSPQRVMIPQPSESNNFPETIAARRGSLCPTISTSQDSCFDETSPTPTTAATEGFEFVKGSQNDASPNKFPPHRTMITSHHNDQAYASPKKDSDRSHASSHNYFSTQSIYHPPIAPSSDLQNRETTSTNAARPPSTPLEYPNPDEVADSLPSHPTEETFGLVFDPSVLEGMDGTVELDYEQVPPSTPYIPSDIDTVTAGQVEEMPDATDHDFSTTVTLGQVEGRPIERNGMDDVQMQVDGLEEWTLPGADNEVEHGFGQPSVSPQAGLTELQCAEGVTPIASAGNSFRSAEEWVVVEGSQG